MKQSRGAFGKGGLRGDNRSGCRWSGLRYVSRSEAHRAEFPMDTLFDVMRGPTRDVFKEPDASDSSIIAKVKPMLHPTWNVDHVSAFDRHAEDRSTFGVQVEHTFAFDSKTDFVLRVRVFFVELRKHRIEVGGFRMEITSAVRKPPAAFTFSISGAYSLRMSASLAVGDKRPATCQCSYQMPKGFRKFEISAASVS